MATTMPNYRPEGDPLTARLVFVGEAPAREEMKQGRPFAGQAGRIHDECLEHGGILRSETYTTNVFDFSVSKPKGDKANFYTPAQHSYPNELIYRTRTGFTDLGLESVARLESELIKTTANVVVPLGGPALLAICGKHGITKWRGSIIASTMKGIEGRKCVPTIHPINASYGQYVNRYTIKADYERALRESVFPDIRRPPYNFRLYPTFSECIEFLLSSAEKPLTPMAVDIEVMFGQVERISYAWSEFDAISVPYLGWPLEQEAELWLRTAQLLEHTGITKIFQNGVFDCQFLAILHGVVVAPPIEDTMIAHHIMYPDFLKGLAFLGSLHTDQPYWKDMVTHGDISKQEG